MREAILGPLDLLSISLRLHGPTDLVVEPLLGDRLHGSAGGWEACTA